MNQKNHMGPGKADGFNTACQAILEMDGDLNGQDALGVFSPLVQFRDPEGKELEKLKQLYLHVQTEDAKRFLVRLLGLESFQKSFFVMLDYLCSFTEQVDRRSIRAILKKYPLDADASLEPGECDAIVSALLDLLETPCPEVRDAGNFTFPDLKTYGPELDRREIAMWILVVLDHAPMTPVVTKRQMQEKGELVVCYDESDYSYGIHPKSLGLCLSQWREIR